MAPRNAAAPASAVLLGRGRWNERLGRRLDPPNSTRNARRQRLTAHLHSCGPRPVLEALIAVESGQALDVVLEDFCRLTPEIYAAVGADELAAGEVVLIEGGQE